MRRFIAILGVLVLGATGCKHVGGKCDCGGTPGEAALYAPMNNYQMPANTAPIGKPAEMPKN